MKTIFTLLFSIGFFGKSLAQVTNLANGLWSNPAIWNTGNIPTGNDSVYLNYDIIIDIDASCRSFDNNGHNVTINSGVVFNILGNGGPLLKRLYYIDTTITAPFDTISRGWYSYDAQNRVVKIASYNSDPVNGDTSETYSFSYFYNGPDTFAFMTVEYNGLYTNNALTSEYQDTVYYVFQNGKCVYDSILNSPSYSVREYQYDPGNIVRITRRDSPAGIYSSVIYQTTDGTEILHQIDTSRTISPPTNTWTRTENTATYLANPNPLAKFSDPIRRPRLWDDIGIGSQRGAPRKLFSQHNYLEDFMTGSTITYHHDYSVQYTYTFRNDGYPLVTREIYTFNAVVKYYKGIFIYQ